MQTRRPSSAHQRPNADQNGRRPMRIIYPESDGKPLAESGIHILALFRGLPVLGDFFAGDVLVYVAVDQFIYFEKGNPSACVAPDLFVVKGVAKLPPRDSYKLWVEGVAPCFVVEFTSPSTAAEDRRKLALYARLGVAECFLHDPRVGVRRRTPSLQGYRLGANGYESIAEEPVGGLLSLELGLRLIVENGRLEFYDQATGERLLDPSERAAVEAAGRRMTEQQAAAAEQQAAAAEQQAAAAEQQAAAAEQRATREAEARRAAEVRLAEIEALLRDLRPPSP